VLEMLRRQGHFETYLHVTMAFVQAAELERRARPPFPRI
jgi:hypothetical protein